MPSKPGAPRSSYVYVQRKGEFVPAGRLDFIDKGEDADAGGIGTRYGSRFTYGTRYAARPDAISIDPVGLPLPTAGDTRPVTHTTPEQFEIFNGLRDAAPDSWGRRLMRKAAPSQVFSEFDYLVNSPDDRVGALAFGPDLSGPSRQPPWETNVGKRINLHKLVEIVEGVLTMPDGASLDNGSFIEQAASMGGARPKATIEYKNKLWLAKFSRNDDEYNVMKAEYAAMSLASECGVATPRMTVANTNRPNGNSPATVYIVERFDRVPAGDGPEHRIPFVSALTMVGGHEMWAHDYSYSDIANAIKQHGSKPKEDMEHLFRRMAFNILCTNDDDHLRNHGFLHDGTGWRLSPAYDIVPKPQLGFERRQAIGVGTMGRRGAEASLENAMTKCRDFGLSPDRAQVMLEDMRAKVAASWEGVFKDCCVPADDMARLATCFAVARDDAWQSRIRAPGKRP